MSEQIHIQDDSGDKEFFTIIPNYIINHSTAIDRALYIEMKRFAGEQGKCFATQETMMKRLGIGRKAYNKSLDYLLEHGWISFVGTTQGKTRPIKTYKVNNIWKLNNSHYKQIQAERTVSFRDTGQKNSKIQAERTVEEDLTNKKNIGEDKSSQSYELEPTDNEGNPITPRGKSKTVPLLRRIEKLRGSKFGNEIKQKKYIKMMLESGIPPKAIGIRWKELRDSEWWQEQGLAPDLKNVADSFDKKPYENK